MWRVNLIAADAGGRRARQSCQAVAPGNRAGLLSYRRMSSCATAQDVARRVAYRLVSKYAFIIRLNNFACNNFIHVVSFLILFM